jgi:hypothetical protein
MHKLGECSLYCIERFDVTGHSSLTLLQKCIAVVHLLAYDMAVDTIDEYLKLGKTTTLDCLEKYYEGIIDSYVLLLFCTT